LESIKIKEDGFDMTQMTTRLKAPSVHYVSEHFKKDDPKELFIAMNEFAYHISKDSQQGVNACYWIEWVIEFESICKKKKEKCECERRIFAPVGDKFQMDVIWIIWDIILQESKKKKNSLLMKNIEALMNLFSIKFSGGIKKRRRFILYFAVLLLTENINYKTEIINDKTIVDGVTDKINVIYKQIKKNEISPQTDYLFNDIGKSNIEKTIEKLDKMKNLDSFIPRK
jgi:hypothetical protein